MNSNKGQTEESCAAKYVKLMHVLLPLQIKFFRFVTVAFRLLISFALMFEWLQSDLCACVHVKKKWRRKGDRSSSVRGKNSLAGQTLSLARETKEKSDGWCTTFWFGTFAMLFSATGCIVRLENTRR